MNEQKKGSKKIEVDAKDFIEALVQDTGASIYSLRDARIHGVIDLKNHVIKVALDILNCEFMDEVDLRCCEFLQMVDFSDCCFHKKFNSGAAAGYAIYRKDLVFNNAVL